MLTIQLILIVLNSVLSVPAHSNLVNGRTAHPFYVSVTEVMQNKKAGILEVSCRIFTDDFENTLRMHYKGTIDLLNPANAELANLWVRDYISRHVQLSIDGKKAAMQYVGYEQREEAIQCYFQVNDANVRSTVAVRNNVLYEYKKEQINIVHVTVNGTRKSYQLVNPDDEVQFSF